MKKWYSALVVLVLGISLMGTSHADVTDYQKWAAGFNGFGDAMNAGNLDEILAGFTEDAVRVHPFAGEVKGLDGQRAFLQSLNDNWRNQKLVVHRSGGQGNTVFVEWTWSAIQKSSGKRVTLDELAWFELAEDGRIQHMRQYFNAATLLKQLK